MKQYLISEERVKSLLKTNQWSEDKDALMNLPEAKFLDLSKVRRYGIWDDGQVSDEENGEFVRYSDLTAIVPDVSVLVEALERIIYTANATDMARIATAALSAYRGKE